MVSATDLLLNLPLVSAAVWLAIGLWPWVRGLRTSPEKAFAAASVLLGAWAFLDWAFIHTTDPDLAVLISKVRITVFSCAWLAFLYFGRWLSRARSSVDYLAVLPVLGSIAIAWIFITQGAVMTDFGPRLTRDPRWYALYFLQTAAYLGLAFGHIGWALRKAGFASPATRNKLAAIFIALLITMAAWLSTNAYNSLTQAGGFRALSSILILPGVLVLVFLAPISRRDLVALLRKLTVTPSRPFAAIWYHNSGHPLAQVVLPGGTGLDAGVLSDLTAAMDHFLSEGLHSDAGSLRQFEHGEHAFVIESGRFLTLVVLLRGRPSEGLRSELRSAIREFEARHGEGLASWDSAANLAEASLTALDEVLTPHPL